MLGAGLDVAGPSLAAFDEGLGHPQEQGEVHVQARSLLVDFLPQCESVFAFARSEQQLDRAQGRRCRLRCAVRIDGDAPESQSGVEIRGRAPRLLRQQLEGLVKVAVLLELKCSVHALVRDDRAVDLALERRVDVALFDPRRLDRAGCGQSEDESSDVRPVGHPAAVPRITGETREEQLLREPHR